MSSPSLMMRVLLASWALHGLGSCRPTPCEPGLRPEPATLTTTLPDGRPATLSLSNEEIVITFVDDDARTVEVFYAIGQWEFGQD